jgi:hypothetical protein
LPNTSGPIPSDTAAAITIFTGSVVFHLAKPLDLAP